MGTALFWQLLNQAEPHDDRLVIAGTKGHHLARVLRVHAGEQGVVVTGGSEHVVEVLEVRDGTVTARVLERRAARGEPSVAVTLLQAVLPNPDFDAVIEAATAIGVNEIVAVQATRSVARPGPARLTRWRSIAESAAEQSHRGRVPAVQGPVSLGAALEAIISGGRLLLLDPRAPTPLMQVETAPAFALAVGPEGGWTDEERSLMKERGALEVQLGPRILRARLAPIVAAAILVQRS